MRNGVLLLMLLSAGLSLRAEVGQRKLPAPGQTREPQWSRLLNFPDGRKMVSDGGILLDAAIAKPASLPTTVIPDQTAKRYADIMASKYPDEFAMSALTSGDRQYTTPSGIGINTNYIDYLKRTVSSAIRFRMHKTLDPIVIVVGDEAVGVVMPMAPLKKEP